MSEEKKLFSSKELRLKLDDKKIVAAISHALSNEQRLDILKELIGNSANINELARKLDIPVSSVALHVNVLEEAGLIKTEMQRGARGNMKLCVRRIDNVYFDLNIRHNKEMLNTETFELPVGSYSLVDDIQPTCGMVIKPSETSRDHGKRILDNPDVFYHPQHFTAQILWMKEGWLEYRLPSPSKQTLKSITISFEACSEAYGYNNDWPSDIFVAINDKLLGIWHCAADYGGRRGALTPAWWSDLDTQYGELHSWRVDERGTWLDSSYISAVSLQQLKLYDNKCIRIRLGVYTGNGLSGGLNLFGKNFGDYSQDINVSFTYGETK